MNGLLETYLNLKQCGYHPALLESLGPISPIASRSILGTRTVSTIWVRGGVVYRDGKAVGPAETLFSHLQLPKQSSFFPAWIGFVSYEFARYFNMPTRVSTLPYEAFFRLYEEGEIVERKIEEARPPNMLAMLQNRKVHAEKGDFQNLFLSVQQAIAEGDVYQVNLSKRHRMDLGELCASDLYAVLRYTNPSPFMGLFEYTDFALVCGSPERLFDYKSGCVTARPIAGTRPRGQDDASDRAHRDDLLQSSKEKAEHAMLVDLLRNDLACIGMPGTGRVNEIMTVEYYAKVMHLVSEVQIKSQAALSDVFRAIFPGGTITGTPKHRAMDWILKLEGSERGIYTGALGYVSACGDADFNILIRSFYVQDRVAYFSAGAGIVAKSQSEQENQEIDAKFKSFSSFDDAIPAKSPDKGCSFEQPFFAHNSKARICFIENQDSFSQNIIEYLRVLGATVDVVDHSKHPDLTGYTHLVLGPGPGTPSASGRLMDWISLGEEEGIPMLGVCLGHQAIGLHFGARLAKAPRPVHGEVHEVVHISKGLFVNVPNPIRLMRYHSLVLLDVPKELEIHVKTQDGLVMAIQHSKKPIFGVQFHPESFLSEHGHAIFANFLQ